MLIAAAGLRTIETARPQGAVVFHGLPGDSRASAITYHPVAVQDGHPAIQPGGPMSRADALRLCQALAGERRGELAWLPSTVLAQGDEALVWYVPGRVRPMLFTGTKGDTVRLEVPWPTLVFSARDRGISLTAIKTRGRPTLRTPVYHAPLMNLYSDGGVCLGSATVPGMAGPESVPDYEAAIYDSRFSHGNFRGNLRIDGKTGEASDLDHLRFWRGLARAKATRFPAQALVPMGQRLGDFLGLDVRGPQ
jgi:PRTRC genetic system protein B